MGKRMNQDRICWRAVSNIEEVDFVQVLHKLVNLTTNTTFDSINQNLYRVPSRIKIPQRINILDARSGFGLDHCLDILNW